MTSQTELMLLMKYDCSPIAKLEDCLEYIGYNKVEANRAASLDRLPIPTFRLRDSQKSPRMIHIKDLAAHIDSQREAATEDWKRMNL